MSSSGARTFASLPGFPGDPGTATYVASSQRQAAAANVQAAATLTAVPGKTNYITSVIFSIGIAAAAVELACQIQQVIGGPYYVTLVGTTGLPSVVTIDLLAPWPATGPNVGVDALIPASGATGPSIAVTVTGFYA